MGVPERRRSFFEPASGAVILIVDWLCFGLEWQLGPLSMVVMSATAFLAAYAAVWRVQSRVDAPRLAHAKAAAGALAAGLPFPIAGTLVGAAILALSGLRSPRS
jgi:hypothetical protein